MNKIEIKKAIQYSSFTILNLNDVADYVAQNISRFHSKKVAYLDASNLKNVLKRKNPYLFKAKNILTAEMLVRSILDAFLSSQEETMFGDFMESVAVFVCQRVFNGMKPDPNYIEGIDLVFNKNNRVYIKEYRLEGDPAKYFYNKFCGQNFLGVYFK